MSQHDPEGWATSVARAIGRRVADVRAQRGYSAQQLSDRLASLGHEINRASISTLENGRRGVSVPDLVAIAAALGVSPILLLIDPATSEPVGHIPGGERVRPWDFVEWWGGVSARATGGEDPKWDALMEPLAEWDAWVSADRRRYGLWLELADVYGDETLAKDPALRARVLGMLEDRLLEASEERDRAALGVPWMADKRYSDALDDYLKSMRSGGASGDD